MSFPEVFSNLLHPVHNATLHENVNEAQMVSKELPQRPPRCSEEAAKTFKELAKTQEAAKKTQEAARAPKMLPRDPQNSPRAPRGRKEAAKMHI